MNQTFPILARPNSLWVYLLPVFYNKEIVRWVPIYACWNWNMQIIWKSCKIKLPNLKIILNPNGKCIENILADVMTGDSMCSKLFFRTELYASCWANLNFILFMFYEYVYAVLTLKKNGYHKCLLVLAYFYFHLTFSL